MSAVNASAGGVGARSIHRAPTAPDGVTSPSMQPLNRDLARTVLAVLFLGGLILPGVDLMRFVLHEHTGRLPLQEGRFVQTPRNTVDAIESGCRHAQAGAVERMYRIAGKGAQCLVSGGAGPALIERLGIPCRYVENLVLEGLARIAWS